MLLAFCILVVLSLTSYEPNDIGLLHSPPNEPPHNFIGPLGAWFGFLTFMAFGVGGYLLPLGLGIMGFVFIIKREGKIWPKVAWLFVILLAVICLLELQPDLWEPIRARLNVPSAGGMLGGLLAGQIFVRLLGELGAAILTASVLLVSVIFLFEVQPVHLLQQMMAGGAALYGRLKVWLEDERDKRKQIEREERELAKRRKRLEDALSKQVPEVEPRAPEPVPSQEPLEELEPEPPIEEERPKPGILSRRKKERAKKPAPVPLPEPTPAASAADYRLPPMSLLDELPPARERAIKGDFQAGSQLLKETLAEFGIDGEVTNVERGPVVTRYEILPAPGVRVERISGLSNNIALAMKAETVRVQAPIPGKGVVGIEVPNPKTTMVYLREILESDAWQKSGAALPLGLGKDVGGRDIVADLAEMPHMLIAGATGAGKTVCMNSILAGLLMSRTPEEMRLMLIDPKIVEFSAFNNLPHLVVPVITDAKKVGHGLRWAIDEMEKRYKLFAQVGVRNIKSYNSRSVVKQVDLFETAEEEAGDEEAPPTRLPYVVIIVDELADLMLVAQAEVENHIARLAQLSRAVGIHMILATQRPSVNVITGTIKANFPARIAFKVAQKVDSRTILDANGADKLLGKGDMLFLPPGSHKLIRAQGSMTSDAEIHSIVEFIKLQGQPQYEMAIKEKLERKTVDIPEGEDDELLETAIEIIRQTRRASTSSLQRRLRIGYTRAARLMDLLEERGVVGPPRGSDPREILIDLDGEIPQNVTSDQNGA